MPLRKSVLMLVENLSVPADPRVWKEAQTLRRLGFHVCIISPQGKTYDQERYICIDGIHIYRYRLSTEGCKSRDYIKEYAIALLKTLGLSLKLWMRHDFSVIHAANPPDIFFLIGLCYRLFGKVYVFDQHDLAPAMFHVKFQDRVNPLYKLLRFLECCSYRTAKIVITTNESQKRHAIAYGHCAPEKVFVVRNGPEIEHLRDISPKPALKRGKRYLLIYIGVMGLQDGIEHALYALHELIHNRHRQDIFCVLIGDGDQFLRLQALAHSLKIDQHTHFTGWLQRQDIVSYLATADIGLSPDPSNELNDHSTMLKTMEYMAMGKPIVAFDLPETRYSAQEAALYAPPNSIDEFADKIETLLDNPEQRRAMGAYGRKRVEEELCWACTQKSLWQVYETLFPHQN